MLHAICEHAYLNLFFVPKRTDNLKKSIKEKQKLVGMYSLMLSTQVTRKLIITNFRNYLQSSSTDSPATLFYCIGVSSSGSQFCCNKAKFNKMSNFVLRLRHVVVADGSWIENVL